MHTLPPAVDPAPALEPERLARYSRQVILPGFGLLSQRRLANARVLVVGAGGLGSAVIPALAAEGVGTIGIIDADVVELSNLPRQSIHGQSDVGRPKVLSAAESVAALDPLVRVIAHQTTLTSANALDILRDYDLVIDGSDNFPTRYLVNDAAVLLGIPLVWGAVHQYGGQAGVCWAVHGPQYRDLFPVPPAPGDVPSCEEAGVLPSVCAVIGAILSGETIKLLTGIGEPLLGRVTSYDALTGGFRELNYERDPAGAAITELIDYDAFCGVAPPPPLESTPLENSPVESTPLAISTAELEGLLEGDAPFTLVDVREPWEAAIATIDGSRLIPLGRLADAVSGFDPSVPLVLFCHHGPRSDSAAAWLREQGLPQARSLAGGIDAWTRDIDPSLRPY